MSRYNRCILVVDDEDDDLMLIEGAFRTNGVTCPIHLVTSGSEAIEYLMGEGKYANRRLYPYPTFIVTDLKMPHGDGLEVLQHIQSNPEWRIIPTVVFSSSEDPDDIKKAYILGASSYHVKPNDFDGLCRQLRILHDYWMTCRVPEVDMTGKQLQTTSKGKLGETFSQPSGGPQRRHTKQ
jgi:CheY-like chemotaxis protein